MNSILDIREMLKRYGTFIYVGDRIADLEIMQDEVRELYQSKLIDANEFKQAVLILRGQIEIEKHKQNKQ
ncbi:YqgQ family protein [Litchfieldia alkalitelluris]|uniref:YqgQ family protein n=1 Tax=Litchfieldia alkalitelluris TaxID=304268 RepID=UPI000997CC76|nr:YqgQ family protein [Litchfieldia alkalitelluris]